MPYLPELASIGPDVHTHEFWAHCARRELRFQRCGACGRFRHPPRSGCPHCGATDVAWVRVEGRGRVFTYTVVHHAAFPSLAARVPYNVVTVEFEDAPGIRLITNVLDVRPEDLRIGMAVEVAWDEPTPGVVLPRVRPA
ncbi:MAG: Zn-ribbon domain-containing OB-fold protein [Candidatus Binatia bacterium]